MRFILHLRDLRGEEEEKKLLGTFLEERRAHEVKSLRRCLAWVLACMEGYSWRLGHHLE
jgi:hypothetical protein